MYRDEHDPTTHTAERGGGADTALATISNAKTIVVNGRTHEVTVDEIGHNELAKLAFPGTVSDGRGALTVAYDHGPAEAPDGLVPSNRTTRVLHGQTFSVSLTDKS